MKRARICGCGHEASKHDGGKGFCTVCGEGGCAKMHRGWGGKNKRRKSRPVSLDSLTADPYARLRRAMGEVTEAIIELDRANVAAIARAAGMSNPGRPLAMARAIGAMVRGRPERRHLAVTGVELTSGAPGTTTAVRAIVQAVDGPSKGELAVLTAVAQGCSGYAQLVAVTGYKTTSVRTYLGELRRAGLLDELTVTAKGRAALGPSFQPLPTGAALLRYWLEKLPTGEQLLLTVLARAYPEPLTLGQLAESSGYKLTSVKTYLGELRRRKLVEHTHGKRSNVASRLLFDSPAGMAS